MSCGISKSSKCNSPSGMPRNPIVRSRRTKVQPVALTTNREKTTYTQILAAFVDRASEYEMKLGDAGSGDPVLAPVDDKGVTAPLGASRQRRRIAA
jgi:hypothetical protein